MTSDHLHDIPDTVELHGEKSERGKLSILLGILKRFIGVKDISSIRLSLPSQLVEPVGNLEYSSGYIDETDIRHWGYLDRPDYFVSIGESDDPVDRMLEVVRFWYTKDLKYVNGKVCKPYNSILGEFFRCKWDVERRGPDERLVTGITSEASIMSTQSTISNVSPASTPILSPANPSSSCSSTTTSTDPHVAANGDGDTSTSVSVSKSHRVVFLCEQVMHHPPVSAFYGECRERGLVVCGNDHLSARFTGTSIKVYAGEMNKGIFLKLKHREDEEYRMTHPCANITGFISLKVHPYVTVQDYAVITCPKSRIKALLRYIEESWIHKPRFAIEGVIFRYDPENDTIDKIKSVPKEDILITISGSWKGQVYYSKPNSTERHLLVDLEALSVIPKECPPEEEQLNAESRMVWKDVTELIHAKEYSKATKVKLRIEAKQRTDAAVRKERNEEWLPKYFVNEDIGGRAELTREGREMLETVYAAAY